MWCRLLVAELRMRRPDVAIPCRVDAEAEVDVPEGIRKMLLVKPTDLLEDAPANREAPPRYGRHAVDDVRAPEVTGVVCRRVMVQTRPALEHRGHDPR